MAHDPFILLNCLLTVALKTSFNPFMTVSYLFGWHPPGSPVVTILPRGYSSFDRSCLIFIFFFSRHVCVLEYRPLIISSHWSCVSRFLLDCALTYSCNKLFKPESALTFLVLFQLYLLTCLRLIGSFRFFLLLNWPGHFGLFLKFKFGRLLFSNSI